MGLNHLALFPSTLEHAVAVVGNEQQRAQGPDEDEEEVPGARVAGEIEQLDQRRRHQPPALWALVTSSRFSATITMAVKPNRITKANTVPIVFLSCWRLIGVPGESSIRRGESWPARVLLPHANPMDQQVDVVIDRRGQQLVRAPGRHDRAFVFLAGITQVNAPVVVVIVEETEAVLVVERRPLSAFRSE